MSKAMKKELQQLIGHLAGFFVVLLMTFIFCI